MILILTYLFLFLFPYPRYSTGINIFDVGIITDNYGIVNEMDIIKNLKIGYPIDRDGTINLVWQCLEIDELQTVCEEVGYSDDYGEVVYDASFNVISSGNIYQFGTRHVQTLDDCHELEEDWKRLIREEEVACFSAFYEWENPMNDPSFKRSSQWTIDKIKSPYGRWSWFGEDAEASE
ncbi:MAG TPA: hypothetical protein VJL87_01575 [Bdellovibrionota bacterium]|nr:hypothetical protein [Bdellovibrionota bacterium]